MPIWWLATQRRTMARVRTPKAAQVTPLAAQPNTLDLKAQWHRYRTEAAKKVKVTATRI